jgi:predicted nucleic acid-binding protein
VIILDTNTLSALMQEKPPAAVVSWLDAQPATSIWTTVVTVFEIEYGLRLLPKNRRRQTLESAFEAALSEDLGGRILPFDVPAARAAADIAASLRAAGEILEIRDVQIAGIARARNATVATRNTKHFSRACSVTNPWEHAAP